MKNLNSFSPYILNLLLGIIGFFVVQRIQQNNTQFEQMSGNFIKVQKELYDLKLEITKINDKMMTDDRVREIVKLELLNVKP